MSSAASVAARQRKAASRITRICYDGDSRWSASWSMSDRYTPRQRALFARRPCLLRLLAINYPRLFPRFYVSRGAYTRMPRHLAAHCTPGATWAFRLQIKRSRVQLQACAIRQIVRAAKVLNAVTRAVTSCVMIRILANFELCLRDVSLTLNRYPTSEFLRPRPIFVLSALRSQF